MIQAYFSGLSIRVVIAGRKSRGESDELGLAPLPFDPSPQLPQLT